MSREIKHTWRFSQTPQEIWECLTKPDLLAQWLGKTDFQPIVGHKFFLVGKDGCMINCEVLEVDPFTNLAYSWQTTSVKDQKSFDSKVIWTLVPHADGTELQLLHNGFVALEDCISHNNGWTMLVGERFVQLLKTGSLSNPWGAPAHHKNS